MDNRIVPLIFALFCAPAFAGYAQVSPPSTWDFVPVERGGRVGQMGVRIAANDSVMGGIVRASERVAINVGGRSVTMPAAYRIAANSATVASRFAFGNPALFVGAGIAAAAYYYYNDKGFSIEDPTTNPHWVREKKQYIGQFDVSGKLYPDLASAFAYACTLLPAGWTGCFLDQANDYRWAACGYFSPTNSSCVVPIVMVTGGPQIVTVPAEPEEFETAFPDPLPDVLPSKLPIPLPVEEPILNPSPDPVPVPQPLRVPMGEPQPIPDTVPQKWRTPVVDIVPSPTVNEPWRVDVQPKDLDRLDNTPLPETYTVPTTPDPDQTTTPKPDAPPTPGLCELFPDILACAKPKLDTPESQDIETKNVEVQITPDSGWGPSDSSCPPPRIIKAGTIEFSFQPICDFMHGMRPIVIAMAWIAGAFILVGAPKGGD